MYEDLNPLALGVQKVEERHGHSSIFCGNTQILTEFVVSRKLYLTMILLTSIQFKLGSRNRVFIIIA